MSSLSSPLPREVDGALAVLSRISGAELALRLGDTSKTGNDGGGSMPPNAVRRDSGGAAGGRTTLVNFLPFLKSVLDDIEVFLVQQTRSIFK